MKRLASSALIVTALVLPVAALADTQGYATSVGAQTLSGVISSIDGKYSVTVRDNRGSLDRGPAKTAIWPALASISHTAATLACGTRELRRVSYRASLYRYCRLGDVPQSVAV
jgi:hypothetical protein